MNIKFINFSSELKLIFWPLILIILGIYLVPLQILGNDLSKIPGDMGDARFNNYILEHGYKYLTGEIEEYWNAPFLFPYPNVIALSDNLLGSLPVYAFFRLIGEDRETSFQLWFLSLTILNFLFCYISLYKWTENPMLAAAGAYIFAFGIYQLGQYNNLQVFPRFIAPLVFYCLWKYLNEKNVRYYFFAIMGLVYQFYCGMYIGFFLFYVLMFFTIAYLIVYQDRQIFMQFRNIKVLIFHLGATLIAIILMAILIKPYLDVTQTMGTRPFEYAINTIPKLRSHFFTSPAPTIWNFLFDYSAYKFPQWWSHYLFVGGLPWISIICLHVLLFSSYIKQNQKKFLLMLFIAFFLSFIFSLSLNGVTLYEIIFKIPGFSSMRSIDRVINVMVIYFILIFVFVFLELFRLRNTWKFLIPILALLTVGDNLINAKEVKRFDKSESILNVEKFKRLITESDYSSYEAIALEVNTDKDYENFEMVKFHLNAMLAAQELGVKVVNGYTGVTPDHFYPFFENPGNETLAYWCAKENCNIRKILILRD